MRDLARYRFAKMAEEAVRADEETKQKKYLKIAIVVILVIYFVFPKYWKAAIYPFLYGKERGIEQKISEEDFFEDFQAESFDFKRKGITYKITPKTKYSGTGRVGIVDHYDGWFNKFYRGWSQNNYINLVPQDVVIVIGKMADPDIFKLFDFVHEERGGGPICKGVKYRKSFMSSFSNEEEWKKSKENYDKCEPYRIDKEYNNYHPIPANEAINAALSMLKYNDIISIEGYLVDVELNGRPYIKSATRHSQIIPEILLGGRHAGWCFVIYTTKVVVNGVLYE